ncbi:hypothetical protein [uncultured Bacteroides sp.]|uniref:hypothetical protein n=1 Tax=uncultured Bacteroides sp. TaxID=162156 RepID=UPI002611F8AE|nr:hypothetical protein [uncultured Bacteroides sp.]
MKIFVSLLTFLCLSLFTYAQTINYQLIKSEKTSSSTVKLTLMVYSKSKKTIDADAQYAAIKTVLFDGCPDTPYNKPLLDSGEATSFEQYPSYFDNFYNYRIGDFILNCLPASSFKKGDKAKGTLYEVQVKVLLLRKDLEKNGIINKMGI